MCADAVYDLIQQCRDHPRFQLAFVRVQQDRGERQRMQCCLVDLSKRIRATASREALYKLMEETNSLYALPSTRPPYAPEDVDTDMREAEIAKHVLLVIRLDDDLNERAMDCVRELHHIRPQRRVFIDVAVLPHIFSVHEDKVRQIKRPWARPGSSTDAVIADWLPYLSQPLTPAALAAAPAVGSPPLALPQGAPQAAWSSIYIDATEFSTETKWELLAHLLMLRDLKRLRLESRGECFIRWFPRANGQESLYLNFPFFLRAIMETAPHAQLRSDYVALRFVCLAHAWCQLRVGAAVENTKFMDFLSATGTGDWISTTLGGDTRHFSLFPDELQGALIRGYVEVINPRLRLRESQELAYSASRGVSSPASRRPASPLHAAPKGPGAALPRSGIIQPMVYLDAVSGPTSSGRQPSYDYWQWVAHEVVWYVQVHLMARGWLRLPSDKLPRPPTLESIRALNMREIEIQSRRERVGGPPPS